MYPTNTKPTPHITHPIPNSDLTTSTQTNPIPLSNHQPTQYQHPSTPPKATQPFNHPHQPEQQLSFNSSSPSIDPFLMENPGKEACQEQ